MKLLCGFVGTYFLNCKHDNRFTRENEKKVYALMKVLCERVCCFNLKEKCVVLKIQKNKIQKATKFRGYFSAFYAPMTNATFSIILAFPIQTEQI